MAKIDIEKLKKQSIDIVQSIKSFALVLFDHLKNGVDYLITKIDSKRTLTDAKKATLVSFISYLIVFAVGYHFIKDAEIFSSISSSFQTSSSQPSSSQPSSSQPSSTNDKARPTENEWLPNNPENCKKITGVTDQYTKRISNKFNAPMSSIKFLGIKQNGSSCEMLIDSPHGGLECPIGGVIFLKSGDYVATELYQTNDPNTYLSAFGSCSDGNFKFY